MLIQEGNLQKMSWMVVVFQFVLIAIYWNALPSDIPVHFNAIGTPDRFGEKSNIFLLPIISLALMGMFRFINKQTIQINPHKYGAKNKEQLSITRLFLVEIQFFISFLFLYLLYNSIMVGIGAYVKLPSTFLLLTFGGFLLLFILYFYRLYKLKRHST